jgi:hypothetical protein
MNENNNNITIEYELPIVYINQKFVFGNMQNLKIKRNGINTDTSTYDLITTNVNTKRTVSNGLNTLKEHINESKLKHNPLIHQDKKINNLT